MNDSAYQRMILGYHGCSRDVGERVLLQGSGLDPSDNDWDWLGRGVYFWEFGLDRASKWADKKFGDEAFVLGAFVNLGRCFDLTDTAHTQALDTFYRRLRDEIGAEKLPMNEPGHRKDDDLIKRHLDCAVINFGMTRQDRVAAQNGLAIAANGVYYQTVRGLFQEGGPAFEGSKIEKKSHVQIAVRDSEAIVGYFKPAKG